MPDAIFIPRPFNSREYKSIKSYYDALKLQREQALKKPLTANLILDLNLICNAKPSPASRSLPWFAKNEGTYLCKLLEPLQEGPDKYSQVWIARVLPSEGTTPNEDVKIVLKFLQPSLSFLPNPDTDWERRYAKPEQLARNEDLAYSELIDTQGICVPHYYGMHEINTPSGEGAWVLAMEYIEGVTIAKLVHDIRVADRLSEDKSLKQENIDLFCRVYRSMGDTMDAILKFHVYFMDPRAQNFIFCPDTGAIIAIDFGDVSFGDGGDLSRRFEFNRSTQTLLDRLGPYLHPVHEWVKNHMPDDKWGYRKICNSPDDDDDGQCALISE